MQKGWHSFRDMEHPRIGDQLWLFPGEPWEGVSPRALTAGVYVLFLRREPQKSVSEFADPAQIDFWRQKERGGAAPLLLPF